MIGDFPPKNPGKLFTAPFDEATVYINSSAFRMNRRGYLFRNPAIVVLRLNHRRKYDETKNQYWYWQKFLHFFPPFSFFNIHRFNIHRIRNTPPAQPMNRIRSPMCSYKSWWMFGSLNRHSHQNLCSNCFYPSSWNRCYFWTWNNILVQKFLALGIF